MSGSAVDGQLEMFAALAQLDEQPGGEADQLTDEQREAVRRRSEPLLVSAAAGSGKTSVLVERFVRAVREDQIDPARILAITFTERAAGELRARVRARLLELGEREAARDTEAAFVGTFHGFCASLLRAHPRQAGLDPDFAILDEGLAARLRGHAFQDALREFLAGERPEAVELLAAFRVDRVRAMLERTYAALRSGGQRHPRLPAARSLGHDEALDAEAAAACVLLDELLDHFSGAYEQRKRLRPGVDFDDLELIARELLAAHRRVRDSWSERFELMMVDEFQDTNPRQLQILELLERHNLFTVGDEHQSIYGFRDADVALFRARHAELDARGGTVALTHNFRAREALLEVINGVFAERLPEFVPLVAGREDGASPSAVDAPGQGNAASSPPAVELLLTDTEGWQEHEGSISKGLPHTQAWRAAEARLLARRVAELVAAGDARACEVALLLRSSGDLEVFERALQLEGLRTLAAVGAFWEHQQTGDLLAYLRSLANPLDEQAVYEVLASPLGGCSRDCLALLAQFARPSGRGAWETARSSVADGDSELMRALAAEDREALRYFCKWFDDERERAVRRPITQLLERAIEQSGYAGHVLELDWSERRLANVHKLLRIARRFEASEGRDLRAFLDHVEHLRELGDVEPDAPVEGVEPEAVRLMTVHAAKGLEFPVVCVADLGRQPNTFVPDLLVDDDRVGLRLARLDGSHAVPTLDYEELCEERRGREAEEEERILYVAMTRARERLLLSGSIDFERWPQREPPTPISWLATALDPAIPELARTATEMRCELRPSAAGGATVGCLFSSPANMRSPLLRDEHSARADLVARERVSGRPGAFETASVEPPAEALAEIPSIAPSIVPSSPRQSITRGPEASAALSYTSLSELERCGYRYYLERVLGLPEDHDAGRTSGDDAGLQARERGTLIHRALELLEFPATRRLSPELLAAIARELGVRTSVEEREELVSLIARAGETPLAARLVAAEELHREHPFAFAFAAEEPLVTGVIDVLAREPQGACLILDYKSDRVAADTPLDELVERDYGIQRLIYAITVLRDGATSVEVVHWFLERPHEPVAVMYGAAERVSLEAQLGHRIEAGRERGFRVSSTPHRSLCLTCPGRGSLCSWEEVIALRTDPLAANETPA